MLKFTENSFDITKVKGHNKDRSLLLFLLNFQAISTWKITENMSYIIYFYLNFIFNSKYSVLDWNIFPAAYSLKKY